DFSARLRQMFAPVNIATRRQNFGANRFDDKNRGGGGSGRGGGAPGRPLSPKAAFGDETYVAASAQLAASPLHRGHRAAIPRNEALILQTALNHPWLLHDHMEELAAAEFSHADTQKLKSALIDVFAHHAAGDFRQDSGNISDADRAELVAELDRLGFGALLARIERSITTLSVWGAQPQAARDDVLLTWKQLVALHRQWHSLTRELKDAELALGQDNSEANYSRLLDVKARLSSLEGTEALIEGFGASSGRKSRSL
ncbi:MAG: DNA primase, partial [Xanthobacteraceae bacterium]